MPKILSFAKKYFQEETRPTAVFLTFLIVGALVYAPSFQAGFQFDDYDTIVNNPLIKKFDWLTFWQHYSSRFLASLTFALNYAFGGLNVFGWHAVNFAIHLAAAYFAYLLCLVTYGTPRVPAEKRKDAFFAAFFTGLIFLVHPIQTQAVTYIVQRATSLAALFYLGAVYFFARGRLQARRRYFVLVFVFAVLGILSKPIVVTLPLMLVIYSLVFFPTQGTLNRRRLIGRIIFSVLLIGLPVVLFGKEKLLGEALKAARAIAPGHYVLTQMSVVMTYVRLLFLPIHQNLDYDYPIAKSFFDFPTYLFFAVIAAILFLAVKGLKKQRVASFGIIWFFIAIAPQSSFFPLLDVIYEHRVYLGCFGFGLFLTAFLPRLFTDRRRAVVFLSLVVAAFSVLTFKRNNVWRDPLTFLTDVVKKSPNKARPHNNLGFYYFENNELDLAEAEYRKAIALGDNYYVAENNLGVVLLKKGRLDEARAIFEQLAQAYADYPEPHVGLGQIYQRLGDNEKAWRLFSYVLYKDPFNVAAYIGTGNILQEQGRWSEAETQYRRAMTLKPENGSAYYNLGNVYLAAKDYYEAIVNFQRALELDPHLAKARNNLGSIYAYYLSDPEEAKRQFEKALAVDPDLAEAQFNLANTLYMLGETKTSRQAAKAAILLYEKQGAFEKAKRLKEYLEANP